MKYEQLRRRKSFWLQIYQVRPEFFFLVFRFIIYVIIILLSQTFFTEVFR